SRLFKLDMKLVDEPLMYHVSLITTAEQKNFFDLLHFSPLKIHISFSMTGSNSGPSAVPQVLNVLLQGIGVTLTDINDIVFKLAYFERDYTFMTHKQLISEATMHYVGQAIKQAYVLVLGLDVIGNPYGLVVGTMKGIEDLFYEPFQGAIQGPGEFAEGLLLGVRSMLGHTVGGMAGAVSKITGAMGKGLAALTFDKDYQRKRQEQLNKQPTNLQEGLARSGKGLVMGVVDGISGVVMKPISGAKEEGVEGFFKGFGKGVVGLVTRPTAGVIDFASGSFGAVKRATELSEEVKRVRPPRFFQPDNLVRSYIREEAEGYKILNVDWTYTWQEIGELPKLVDRGIQLCIKDNSKKRKLGKIFGSADQSKVILIQDYNTRQVLIITFYSQILRINISFEWDINCIECTSYDFVFIKIQLYMYKVFISQRLMPGPPQLPPLFKGQQIKTGPYTVTVTDEMVTQRERENQELYRAWLEQQQRRVMGPDGDGSDYIGDFKEEGVRRSFVRKVFLILTLQLLFTASVIAVFLFVDAAKKFMILHWYLWIIAFVCFTISYCAVSCSESARRKAPYNYILLCKLTIALSYLAAFTSVSYEVEIILMALGMSAVITFVVGVLATFSKYLYFDVQTIMGGRRIEIEPDEVVFATVQIYVDIVMLYQYVLMFMGLMH
ncbi:Vacuolar protein sorting-associated protein 13C, partial [Dufourea novaeangliae]